ncbi:hypothetical protein H0486_12420 [Lachnospiraceae bacterium MD1]|jgi:hypothetical protein|uniref:Uncharacterized protein n=1 Tax=Variimorphobacter saccharofermentans TaxID=2755051 RepID=A0A839K3U3_9FIRM|nr:hypothetical protein [Variimorphobacter saccharofermentans]MBB2183679.1 hypothetical protein [Variimorphobacter saccharofermentans]
MLGKLFKHEMKATARLLLPLYVVIVVLTIMDRIVLNLDVFEGIMFFIPGMLTTLYVISLIAIVVVTIVMLIIRFYKNLISDEGYLMFTLPVKTHQLINAKMFASTIWIIASIVAVCTSVFALLITPNAFADIIRELRRIFSEIISTLDANAALFYTELILLTLFSIINNILKVYMSIAIGQLLNRYKILGGIAAYIIINIVLQFIGTILLVVGASVFEKRMYEFSVLPQIAMPLTLLLVILLSIIYYVVTHFIFSKKLNLE